MPFTSKKQQRFMFATQPETAKEMAGKMSKKDFKDLPEMSKSKKKKGKLSVMLAALKEMSN
jgi:hypothetical protein